MKIKTIAISIALVTLGSISGAMAGQGENTLNFTLNADVTKAVSADNVQIRVYNQGKELPSANINETLQEVLQTGGSSGGNIVWGSTGKFDYYGHDPQIDPSHIYAVEVYSKNNTATYNGLSTECADVALQNGADTQNVLTGNCDRVKGNTTAYVGVANQVPDALNQIISAPTYFEPSGNTTYTMSSPPVQGDALYFPLAFFAHLPKWGDDLSAYTPGNYSASGSMIIKASWV